MWSEPIRCAIGNLTLLHCHPTNKALLLIELLLCVPMISLCIYEVIGGFYFYFFITFYYTSQLFSSHKILNFFDIILLFYLCLRALVIPSRHIVVRVLANKILLQCVMTQTSNPAPETQSIEYALEASNPTLKKPRWKDI
jgi:hypothetical protein